MFMRTTSIRGKIAAGYVVGFLFSVLLALVLFVNLLVVEDRVASYSSISRLLDTTLEMRRYEKNYLLYGKREDLDAAMAYAASASALLADGGAGGLGRAGRGLDWTSLFSFLDRDARRPDFSPERTTQLLVDYSALLRRAREAEHGRDAPDPVALGSAVRDLGRTITQIAEQLSSAESRSIQELVRASRTTLVLLLVLFLVGTAIIARMVLLTALRPLEELEVGMQRIASGDFRPLPVGARSDEIGSMNVAFNRMIHEVFEHRHEMMQSDRLASLGTMLAGVAHELNNPLSNVSTSAEILREDGERASPAERRELVDQIISQTERATDIIRNVLEFSRGARFERRPVNLLSAVNGSVILVRGEMPPNVSLRIDVAPEIELMADKGRLQQAFVNLLTNAMDAVRGVVDREARITVSARETGADGVEIVFGDTGAGIPRHLVDRIFDPFFSTKDVGHGTGLGLYLTHQIMEQHGGTIRVESTLGEGTTVTLTLPRRDPTNAAPASDAVPKTEGA